MRQVHPRVTAPIIASHYYSTLHSLRLNIFFILFSLCTYGLTTFIFACCLICAMNFDYRCAGLRKEKQKESALSVGHRKCRRQIECVGALASTIAFFFTLCHYFLQVLWYSLTMFLFLSLPFHPTACTNAFIVANRPIGQALWDLFQLVRGDD